MKEREGTGKVTIIVDHIKLPSTHQQAHQVMIKP
jgi:hypothetical protein